MDSSVEKFLTENYKIIRQIKSSSHGEVSLAIGAGGEMVVLRRVNYGGLPYGILKENPHPLWPKILFWAESEDETVVVESYAGGENLADRLKKKIYFGEAEAGELIRQAADGLTVLHGLGVIHRDIKPSNLIGDGGHYRLIDFDAARCVKEKAADGGQILDSGTDTRLLGTRGYAPPEQHGYAPTDQRSDIYALCVTVLELLGPDYDGRLKPVLLKGAELDPKHRYASAAELKKAANSALAPWWKKKSAALALAMAILAAIAVKNFVPAAPPKSPADGNAPREAAPYGSKANTPAPPETKKKKENPAGKNETSLPPVDAKADDSPPREADNGEKASISVNDGEVRISVPMSPIAQRNAKIGRVFVLNGLDDREVYAASYDEKNGDFLACTTKGELLLYNSEYEQLCAIAPYDPAVRLYEFARRTEMVINFYILYTESPDRDKDLGWWRRQDAMINSHVIPIYFKYRITPDRKIELISLSSGKGKTPIAFDCPLLEKKNVRMAQIFLSRYLDVTDEMARNLKNKSHSE